MLWRSFFYSAHLHDVCFTVVLPIYTAVVFCLGMIISLEAIRIMRASTETEGVLPHAS